MKAYATFSPEPGIHLRLAATDLGLFELSFGEAGPARDDDHPVLQETIRQLTEYFLGERREFSVPLDLHGTPFQLRVWNALLAIPYGETRSYADLARAVGSPKGVRAVGRANGVNPVAIIVPCHRVIASDGTLCGYGGGLEIKRKLLELERTGVKQ
jgi:methylated-DNA-[protein]-cysteine S-methyltransferase